MGQWLHVRQQGWPGRLMATGRNDAASLEPATEIFDTEMERYHASDGTLAR